MSLVTRSCIDRLKLSLNERNERECNSYRELITSHSKLIESNDVMRRNVRDLEHEVLDLQKQLARLPGEGIGGAKVDTKTQMNLQTKLLSCRDDLNQAINREKDKLNKLIEAKEENDRLKVELGDRDSKVRRLTMEKQEVVDKLKLMQIEKDEVASVNQTMNDEYQALQMNCTSLEDKLRKLQTDNSELVTRWMNVKAKDADRINRENEIEAKVRLLQSENENLRSELQTSDRHTPLQQENGSSTETSRSGRSSIFSNFKPFTTSLKNYATNTLNNNKDSTDAMTNSTVCDSVILPSKVLSRGEMHEGGVTSIFFSRSGRYTATGGDDKLVKLWDMQDSEFVHRATLRGANAGILSIDFDDTERLIMASSSDFSCRLWSPTDHRLKLSLTGHTNKVMAARFMRDQHVISGSQDRTLKQWDLRSRACTKTIFVGSACNDLVTGESSVNLFISGHTDKKIRFWDTRSDIGSNEILLQGKITSLTLSPDYSQLLSCSKDDTLRLIDLKMHQVVGTFTADGFRVGLDYCRACFSPDGKYVAAGSVDGTVFVWNVGKGKLEHSIKEHNKEVHAVLWHSSGKYFLSAERSKRCYLWTES